MSKTQLPLFEPGESVTDEPVTVGQASWVTSFTIASEMTTSPNVPIPKTL